MSFFLFAVFWRPLCQESVWELTLNNCAVSTTLCFLFVCLFVIGIFLELSVFRELLYIEYKLSLALKIYTLSIMKQLADPDFCDCTVKNS